MRNEGRVLRRKTAGLFKMTWKTFISHLSRELWKKDNFPLSIESLVFADRSNKMYDVFCCGILRMLSYISSKKPCKILNAVCKSENY